MKPSLESTPVIHVSAIAFQKYMGPVELENGDYYEITRIRLADGTRYLVAGSACNAGLIPDYAMPIESGTSAEETLADLYSDLEALPNPSDSLLAWHGSLVI